jgi:hypothetical protein
MAEEQARPKRTLERRRSHSSILSDTRGQENTGVIEKALFKYGVIIQAGAWKISLCVGILFMAFGLGGTVFADFKMVNDDADAGLQYVWSPAKGRLRDELKIVNERWRYDWYGPYEVLQFTQKDLSKIDDDGVRGIGDGGDVLQVGPLEDMLMTVKVLRDLNHTADGKTYTAFDICQRQAFLDTPSIHQSCVDLNSSMPKCNMVEKVCSGKMPAPMVEDEFGNVTEGKCDQPQLDVCYNLMIECRPPRFPCIWPSPLECFSEALEYQHPDWQWYETGGDNPEYVDLTRYALARFWNFPYSFKMFLYSEKPSFRNMTGDEISREVLATPRGVQGNFGCDFLMEGTMIPGSWVIGGRQGSEVGIIRWDWDAEKRINFRMHKTKPADAVTETIDKVTAKIPEVVRTTCLDLNDKLQHTRISLIGSDALGSDPLGGGVSIGDMCLSYGFLVLTLVFFFGNPCNPFASHCDVVVVGSLLVLLNIPVTLGFIRWFKIPFSFFNYQTCPYLALGLGVNDLVMLLSVFSHVDRRPSLSRPKGGEVAVVLVEAGVGITLTSTCNVVIFFLGSFVDIPGIASFCMCASAFAATNWFLIILFVPCLLVYEDWRMEKGRPELLLFCCHAARLRSPDADKLPRDNNHSLGPIEHFFHRFISDYWSRILVHRNARCSLTLVFFGFLGLCTYGSFQMDTGYDIHELFPSGERAADLGERSYGFKVHLHHFDAFGNELSFNENMDWPNQQVQVIELVDKIMALKKDNGINVVEPAGALWLKNLAEFAPIATALRYACEEDGQCESFKDYTMTGNPNSSVWNYSHPVHAPNGLVDPDRFYTLNAGWGTWPPKKLFPPYFAMADIAGYFKFALEDNNLPPSEDNKFTYVFYGIRLASLKDSSDNTEAILKIREAIDASPLKDSVFPSGVIFTFWEIFNFLWDTTWFLMVVMVGVVFVLTMIFTCNPMVALIVGIASVAIVVQIWGVVSQFLRFSFFVSTPLLMAGGLSIEFTAHIGSIFARHHGTLQERVNYALQIALLPTIVGSLTTVMSLLPLSWSPIAFIVRYFFLMLTTIQAVGLLNAFVFLPAILACLVPSICVAENGPLMKKKRLKETFPDSITYVFDGTWLSGVVTNDDGTMACVEISGTNATWEDGRTHPFKGTSEITCERYLDEVYAGKTNRTGDIKWSDGDIWKRVLNLDGTWLNAAGKTISITGIKAKWEDGRINPVKEKFTEERKGDALVTITTVELFQEGATFIGKWQGPHELLWHDGDIWKREQAAEENSNEENTLL